MKLAVISFTRAGNRLNERLVKHFRNMGEECDGYVPERFLDSGCGQTALTPLEVSLKDWTGCQFESRDGIVFVGAAGIAVRAIAPFVKDKMRDPAVVVVDERGRFAVSLLSGHVGGANKLAGLTAKILGAVPVITTATDVNGIFAVDVFAEERGLFISDRETAKEISAEALDGKPVGFYSDVPVTGELPEGFTQNEPWRKAVWITWKTRVEEASFMNLSPAENKRVLRLVPRVLSVGIGCRKGISKDAVEAAVFGTFEEYQLDFHAAAGVASVDLKKEEPGLVAFCERWGLEFSTYGALELEQVPGDFTESKFVRETTGTGNVCERAALWDARKRGGGDACGEGRDDCEEGRDDCREGRDDCGEGRDDCREGRDDRGESRDDCEENGPRLLVRKQTKGGVTVAVAVRNITIRIPDV